MEVKERNIDQCVFLSQPVGRGINGGVLSIFLSVCVSVRVCMCVCVWLWVKVCAVCLCVYVFYSLCVFLLNGTHTHKISWQLVMIVLSEDQINLLQSGPS